jgi:hypothetical protein
VLYNYLSFLDSRFRGNDERTLLFDKTPPQAGSGANRRDCCITFSKQCVDILKLHSSVMIGVETKSGLKPALDYDSVVA